MLREREEEENAARFIQKKYKEVKNHNFIFFYS